jgi:hypothetical protein
LAKRNIADLLNFSESENENNSEEAKQNLDSESYGIYQQRISNPFEPIAKNNCIGDSFKDQNSILSNKFKEAENHNHSTSSQNTSENCEIFNSNKAYQLSHEDIKIEIDHGQIK